MKSYMKIGDPKIWIAPRNFSILWSLQKKCKIHFSIIRSCNRITYMIRPKCIVPNTYLVSVSFICLPLSPCGPVASRFSCKQRTPVGPISLLGPLRPLKPLRPLSPVSPWGSFSPLIPLFSPNSVLSAIYLFHPEDHAALVDLPVHFYQVLLGHQSALFHQLDLVPLCYLWYQVCQMFLGSLQITIITFLIFID